MQEEMITLYHLRDWYGNVKKERNNNHKSAIQQFVSQEATDFSVQRLHGSARSSNTFNCIRKPQMHNAEGSPQPGASRSQCNILTDSWIRSKSQAMTLSCRIRKLLERVPKQMATKVRPSSRNQNRVATRSSEWIWRARFGLSWNYATGSKLGFV